MRDNWQILSDKQEITGDAASTRSIDMLLVKPNIQEGAKKFYVECCITGTFVGGTSCIFSLQDSADGLSYTNTKIVSADIADATLLAGYLVFKEYLPPDIRQFIQGYYDDTGAHTAGSFVDMWIDCD